MPGAAWERLRVRLSDGAVGGTAEVGVGHEADPQAVGAAAGRFSVCGGSRCLPTCSLIPGVVGKECTVTLGDGSEDRPSGEAGRVEPGA